MTQIQPYKAKVQSVHALLEKGKPQLALALPKHITPDRMVRIVLTEIQKTPKLLECSQTSLLGAVVQAAQLGLEPGLAGMAYLVPFKGQVQLIPGYRGLMNLAQRSGLVSTIYAEVVCKEDEFEYELGLELKLRHIPSDERDPSDKTSITHFYAVAQLKDGGKQFVVMTLKEVEAIRKRSKASHNGPWVTDFVPMGKKSTIRQLCKFLPMSVELQTAVSLDEREERGIPQDLGALVEIDIDTPGEESSEVQDGPQSTEGSEEEKKEGAAV